MALSGSYAGEAKKQGVSRSRDTFPQQPQSGNEVLECLESCRSPVPTRRVKLDSGVREGGGSSGRSRGDALTETQERQADSDPLRPLFICHFLADAASPNQVGATIREGLSPSVSLEELS